MIHKANLASSSTNTFFFLKNSAPSTSSEQSAPQSGEKKLTNKKKPFVNGNVIGYGSQTYDLPPNGFLVNQVIFWYLSYTHVPVIQL